MNQINEQFKKTLQSVRMTSSDKEAVRGALLSEIALNPFKNGVIEASVRNSSSIRHKLRRKTLTRHNILTRMPIAILIAIFMGGGVSYAAAGTVPGDTLYPVKIHVNENAESAFAIGGDARAKLEAKLALRRLEEAEKIESKHEMSKEDKAELKANFDEHTTNIEAELKGMEKRDDAKEISSQFEISLSQHMSALGLLGVHVEQGDEIDAAKETSDQSATTSLKHKEHLDGILNAVFRSNNKVEAGEDRNDDKGSLSTSTDVKERGEKKESEHDATDESGHRDTESHIRSTGSVDVGNTLKVNTDTHAETSEQEGIRLGL